MSVPVAPEEIEAVAGARPGPVYLLTVRDESPRALSVDPEFGGAIRCTVGSGTAGAAKPGDRVTLLWGVPDDKGLALIADGRIDAIDGLVLVIEPDRAVLHRTQQ